MKLYWRDACLFALLLYAGIAPAAAAQSGVPVVTAFAPIDVLSVNAFPHAGGTADEALRTGKIQQRRFVMARPATKPWRIAFLFPHLKDPYWVGCAYGVMTEARRLGISATIIPATGYNDLIGQLQQMDEAVAAHYDAIVISPISLAANDSSIARAAASGIPVFELANDSTSAALQLKVTTSLLGMGQTAIKWIIRDAQRRGLKHIEIGLLPGPADAGWVKGEVDGTRLAIQGSPVPINIVDIQYGDSDRIVQTQLASRMVARYGKTLDYIVGCTGCAPAAWLPIKESGLEGKVRIVAYDLTREIALSIHNKEIVAAVDTKSVSQARVVTDSVVDYLEGRGKHMPPVMLVQLGLMDGDNYSRYAAGASIPPADYVPVLSYVPADGK